jgi:two-component system CheB/CheR fusion protein
MPVSAITAGSVDFVLSPKRIAGRMALQKIASLNKYVHILRQNPEEAQALADDISIPVSSFFRDMECFQALRKRSLA